MSALEQHTSNLDQVVGLMADHITGGMKIEIWGKSPTRVVEKRHEQLTKRICSDGARSETPFEDV
jgi:hypothetical protein